MDLQNGAQRMFEEYASKKFIERARVLFVN